LLTKLFRKEKQPSSNQTHPQQIETLDIERISADINKADWSVAAEIVGFNSRIPDIYFAL
jgi:hypothetical protein